MRLTSTWRVRYGREAQSAARGQLQPRAGRSAANIVLTPLRQACELLQQRGALVGGVRRVHACVACNTQLVHRAVGRVLPLYLRMWQHNGQLHWQS